jgi:hypothetical protein
MKLKDSSGIDWKSIFLGELLCLRGEHKFESVAQISQTFKCVNRKAKNI